jgi:membrane protease YdiL (CAAX protease family)
MLGPPAPGTRDVAAFFLLAYALSWGCWGLTIAWPGSTVGGTAYYAAGFGPLVAALVATRLAGRRPWAWFKGLWRWRVAPRFWAFAFGFPVLLALAASLLHGVLGGEVTLDGLGDRLVLWGPTFLTTALIGGGNEEPGWRGFALPGLQARLQPVAATLLLGIAWAFWHLPLIAVRGGGMGAFAMDPSELLTVAVTIVSIATHAFWYTWLFNRTGSVLLCILLHGGYNAANARFVLVPDESLHGGDERQLLFVMTGLLVLSVASLVAATGGRLGGANHG